MTPPDSSDAQNHPQSTFLEKEKIRTLKSIRKRIRRIEKGITLRKQELEETQKAEEFEHKGNLLKTYFHLLHPHSESITLPDYLQDEKPTFIELDKSLSPEENLQFYYKKSKKLKKAHTPLLEAISQLEKEKDEWQKKMGKAALITSLDELFGFQKKEHLLAKSKEKSAKDKPCTPYHTFVSAKGFSILVGRSAKENDTLTFSVAKKDDLWLHVEHMQGAHVVIRKGKALSIDEETLLDAACLALYFSKARALPPQVFSVTYTERKHIRRIKGAPKGKVGVAHFKTKALTLDLKRIALIKERPKASSLH